MQVSLHLKLPGELALDDAHDVAEQVERAIREAIPDVAAVQTHLEPLAEAARGRELELDAGSIARIVEEETGKRPQELRFLTTDQGLVAYLTLTLDPSTTLAEAHKEASGVEERIRNAHPEIADVIVHTEP